MPFQTTRNPTTSQAIVDIAKMFTGDPKADAAYRDTQLKNETEFLRQKQLSEQTLTEAVRRKSLEAQAAAQNALAGQRTQATQGVSDLAALFQQPQAPAGPPDITIPTPGVAPAPAAPAGGLPADLLAKVFMSGIKPAQLSALQLQPGLTDEQRAMIQTSTGELIGKDDYVSLADRLANRRYEVGAGERLTDQGGQVQVPVDPAYAAAQTALARQREATAGFQERRGATAGGGKVPRLPQKELNRMIRGALISRGGQLVEDDRYIDPAEFLSRQPEIYPAMSKLIDAAYSQSGGRASAVQDALAQYLSGADFSQFGETVDAPGFGFGFGADVPAGPDVELGDVEAIIQSLLGQNTNIPAAFTEGGNEGLQNRQDVGNVGGWKLLNAR